jgi:hypothetical protein
MRHDPRYAREEPDEDSLDHEHEAPQHHAREEKLTKSEANYRRSESCSECGMFESGTTHESVGTCRIVRGVIAGDMLCDHFRKAGASHEQEHEDREEGESEG